MPQYIDKDALAAEIKKRRSKNARNKLNLAASFEDNYLLSFIDTLEVKDVGNNFWKPADGDDLPEIDREVIALLSNGKVVYAHRPNPDGWDGKNILTGDVRHYDVQTYDKGGWNQPNVKWWLDLDLPK